MKIFISTLMLYAFVHLVYGELRTKAIYLSINQTTLTKRSYLGFGKDVDYQIKYFDGYQTSSLPSFAGIHEYLYLIKDKKKIVKISEFHHSNYSEIKGIINSKFEFKGHIKLNMKDEFIEIFS